MAEGTRNGGIRLWPGVVDLTFAVVLASVLIGGRARLLNDPGTSWHLRLGHDILRTGQVPRVDTLTFTHAGTPWVDQSWLFDAGLAVVVGRSGWAAAVVASGLLIASIYAGLVRGLVHDGRAPLVALVTGVLASGIGAIHFLVRPHLFTLAFFLILLRICQRQHERGGWGLAWALPLTAVWANLHGGFLAAPVIVASAGIGHAVSGAWDAGRRRTVGAFLLTSVGCVAAGLFTPYGFDLYRHVGGLLTSGVTVLIDEYQPIPFGKPDARVVEGVILALVAIPVLTSARMSRYELVHTLVWLHLSLASLRHVPLFALAVAPGLARLLDGLVGASGETDRTEAAAVTVWPGVAGLVLVAAVPLGLAPGGFDPAHWPVAAFPALNAVPESLPLFHEQDWGGMVSARSEPRRRVFIDDRFELYGRDGVIRYLNALAGGPEWESIRDQYGIGLVWVRPERELTRRLDNDPGWVARHRDDVSVLYERVEVVRPGKTLARGLNPTQASRNATSGPGG